MQIIIAAVVIVALIAWIVVKTTKCPVWDEM